MILKPTSRTLEEMLEKAIDRLEENFNIKKAYLIYEFARNSNLSLSRKRYYEDVIIGACEIYMNKDGQ